MGKRLGAWVISMMVAVVAVVMSVSESAHAVGSDFERWLANQENISVAKMMANISPSDAHPGVVVASPQKAFPDYYYHWVRDAALTMDTVVSLWTSSTGKSRNEYKTRIVEFARFSRKNQLASTKSGMGEPKFYVDGRGYDLDWCRPQNDGPALRALTLSRFANLLLDKGERDFVVRELYDSRLPTQTVIKADLEFVAHHWQATNCDIWEEVHADHFYTRLAQMHSLIDGSKLAARLGDQGAAHWYMAQANAIQATLAKFWDAKKGYFVAHLNHKGGLSYKDSNLDAQVVLALLHAPGTYRFSDARVLSTVRTLTERFRALYPINQRAGVAGVGIGRYAEDLYDGAKMEGGNPWILITAAFANVYYRAAGEMVEAGDLAQAKSYVAQGDQFMMRVQYHANPDGSMSEQFDRRSGYMTSARDLTWSHAEIIQASWERKKTLRLVRAGIKRMSPR